MIEKSCPEHIVTAANAQYTTHDYTRYLWAMLLASLELLDPVRETRDSRTTSRKPCQSVSHALQCGLRHGPHHETGFLDCARLIAKDSDHRPVDGHYHYQLENPAVRSGYRRPRPVFSTTAVRTDDSRHKIESRRPMRLDGSACWDAIRPS